MDDSETGLITGTPNQEGYYVIGVKVEEYRNGVYLGEIIRDFRFLVVDCEVATSSVPIADIYCDGLTVDFENERGGYYCTYLSGSWARERIVEETKLQPGTFSIGSTRGTSSHVHNPFFAISRGGPSNENNGDIFGFALVYHY